MPSKVWRWCLAGLLPAVWAGDAPAVKPADALGDHMVLQRGKAAPVWGTARAGEKVTVRFAGQAKTTTAGKDGRWMVRLDPMDASTESRELAIEGAGEKVAIADVLVGDVWIAGGQSNMGRDVNRSWRPDDQRMDYPHIRFLKVGSRGSKYPQTDLVPPPPPTDPPRDPRVTEPGRWYACTQATTPECCAVGFFFAERIYQATGVPQALLWNAWAGSTVQEWIPQFGWHLRPELEDIACRVDAWYPSTETGRAAYRQAVDEIAAWAKRAGEALKQGDPFPYPQPLLPEPDDGGGQGRGTTLLYNGRVHPLVPYAIQGILWYQGESDYANRRYRPAIEAMAEAWRTLFAAPGERPADLPFYFVQMQRCGSYMSPEVRDQQFESYFTIPNSGMAVLIDLDMNLHPANKYDSGRRLALWSLARDYGKDVAFSGPLYKGHRVEGDKVVVEFDHAHGGLFIGTKNKLDPPQPVPDGKLTNLEITADGRSWVAARSRIDGERLIAWADGMDKPAHVRYCWKSQADEPFLYNQALLPAAQFNTTTDYALPGRAARPKPAEAPRPARTPGREAQMPPEVQLASAIGDNAVLQRGLEVPVWGSAGPGEEVVVAFAGQEKKAAADRFGRWRIELDPMPAAAEGRSLTVRGPRNTVEIRNVRVGDVWLYLSQSFHLGGPAELRAEANSLPPICISASAGVWEFRNHSRRPQEPSGEGARWSEYQQPGRYFRNDGFYLGLGLARATGVPVGVLGLGASTLESMTPPEGFRAFEDDLGELGRTVTTWTTLTPRGREAHLKAVEAIDEWLAGTRRLLASDEVTFRDLTQPPRVPGPPEHERGPMTAYNFVIHRYMPAAFRGVIIQPKTFGVGDRLYLTKAKALIAGLREACGRQDMPVCFVQMHSPDRGERNETQDPNDWVRLRAAQSELSRLPHTTVIATYDLKSTGRSEPDVGLRAAQWAAALVADSPVRTGPTCAKHRVDGGRVVVEFDNVGEGLMAGKVETGRPPQPIPGDRLGGFQVAGADGRWHDAEAAIQGKAVIVSCGQVSSPLAVRYAWAPEPTAANLFNRNGFPALPFNTAER